MILDKYARKVEIISAGLSYRNKRQSSTIFSYIVIRIETQPCSTTFVLFFVLYIFQK